MYKRPKVSEITFNKSGKEAGSAKRKFQIL